MSHVAMIGCSKNFLKRLLATIDPIIKTSYELHLKQNALTQEYGAFSNYHNASCRRVSLGRWGKEKVLCLTATWYDTLLKPLNTLANTKT